MVRRYWLIYLIVLTVWSLASPARTRAQDEDQVEFEVRADQLQRLLSLQRRNFEEEFEKIESEQGETLPITGGPDADLGRQRILRRTKQHRPFFFRVMTGGQHTNNAFNSPVNELEDNFSMNELTAEYRPEPIGNFSWKLSTRYQAFVYDEYNDFLNFNLYQTGGSARYRIAPRGLGLVATAGYKFQRLTDTQGDISGYADSKFQKHVLTGGLSRPVPITRYQIFRTSLTADVEMTHSVEEDFTGTGKNGLNDTEKNTYGLSFSYFYDYSRSYNLSISYGLNNSVYDHQFDEEGHHRRDWTHSFTTGLQYKLSEGLNLDLTSSYTDNRSNSDLGFLNVEYTSFSVGTTLTYQFRT